jgi:putative flippase GtrA
MALDAGLYSRVRQLLPELLKFGVVGGIGSVIDLGGTAVLHGKYHVGPLESKAIAVTAATVFTYVGSRFWTFKDRENQSLRREAVLFIVLNLVGLLIAEVVLGFTTYVLAMRGNLEYNAASVLGTGLGTLWRYYAYKKWVFLAPAVEPAAAQDPALADLSDYPPWELDPAYLATAPAPAYSAAAEQSAAHSSWDAPAQFQPLLTAPVPPGEDREDRYSPAPRPAAGRHRRQ